MGAYWDVGRGLEPPLGRQGFRRPEEVWRGCQGVSSGLGVVQRGYVPLLAIQCAGVAVGLHACARLPVPALRREEWYGVKVCVCGVGACGFLLAPQGVGGGVYGPGWGEGRRKV